ASVVHHGVLAFACAMLLLFGAVCGSSTGSTHWRETVLGILMGGAISFWGGNYITTIIIFLFCIYAWRTYPLRELSVRIVMLSAGFLLGISPSLSRMGGYVIALNHFYSTPHIGAWYVIRRAYTLAYSSLFKAFSIGNQGPTPWHCLLYILAVIAYFWMWYTLFSRKKYAGFFMRLFLACYPLLYIGLVAVSRLVDAYGFSSSVPPTSYGLRYACPVMNILIVAEAIMLCDWLGSKNRIIKFAGGGALVFVVGAGIYSYYTIVTPCRIGYGLRRPGYFAQEIGCRLAEDYLDNFPVFTAVLRRVDTKGDWVVRNDIARGAAWLTCLNTITGDKLENDDPKKYPIYEDIVAHHVPPRLQNLFREEIGSYLFWHSKFDLSACLDKITRGLTAEDADASFIGVARMLPAWTTDPGKLNKALDAIPLQDKNRLACAMGQYFAADPRRDASIAAIADRLALKKSFLTRCVDFFTLITGRRRGRTPLRESFLAGCREPYGTRMYWPPLQCH
ncbi:MAG: hypothetical protein WCP22_11820, partial [Chlamydiota bacterium]